jgi:hypothetical protein
MQQLAAEFIENGLKTKRGAVWLRGNGSYDWGEAAKAHYAELPLNKLERYDKHRRRLHSRIHYKLWLEHESERIGEVIKSLQSRFDELRSELVSFDVFSREGSEPAHTANSTK